MFNIVKRRYFFFGLSLAVIIPGMLALVVWGLPLAIDFTGGSLLDVRFESGSAPLPEEVRTIYSEFGFDDSLVQTSGQDEIIVRSKHMEEAEKNQIITEMENRFNTTIEVLRSETVGPSVGQEIATRAAGAVGLAALGIMLYITLRSVAFPTLSVMALQPLSQCSTMSWSSWG
jgi:preprotein translocase subunit SecF